MPSPTLGYYTNSPRKMPQSHKADPRPSKNTIACFPHQASATSVPCDIQEAACPPAASPPFCPGDPPEATAGVSRCRETGSQVDQGPDHLCVIRVKLANQASLGHCNSLQNPRPPRSSPAEAQHRSQTDVLAGSAPRPDGIQTESASRPGPGPPHGPKATGTPQSKAGSSHVRWCCGACYKLCWGKFRSGGRIATESSECGGASSGLTRRAGP